jgi:predicted tellurium resistance membrane protein TerC
VKGAEGKKHVALTIMIAAVMVSVGVMLIFSGRLSGFIKKHPALKILALSFLLMIGVMLVAEGFDFHIPKGYIYFSMAFAVVIELINMRVRKAGAEPVHLHNLPAAPPKG